LPIREISPISTDIIIDYIKENSENDKDKEKIIGLLNGKDFIKKHEITKLLDENSILDGTIRRGIFSLYCHEEIFKQVYKNFSKGYSYGSGALFIASKYSIQRIPKDYWQEIYSTLQYIHPDSGYGLEKMWKYLLDV
jgi:hypothetical protein